MNTQRVTGSNPVSPTYNLLDAQDPSACFWRPGVSAFWDESLSAGTGRADGGQGAGQGVEVPELGRVFQATDDEPIAVGCERQSHDRAVAAERAERAEGGMVDQAYRAAALGGRACSDASDYQGGPGGVRGGEWAL